MQHARHVFRVLFLLVVVVAAFALVRAMAAPVSYGRYGAYRADNVAEQRDHKPLHGGAESCQPCHAEQFAKVMKEKHQPVNCEVCHGTVALHAEGGKKIADMPREASWTLCAKCHQKIAGRPEGFPQKDLAKHVGEMSEKLEGAVCLKECHNPHAPTP